MKITEALALAQTHIYVSYAGGYYVAKPYYGLSDASGPTLAPSSTTTYHQALADCRVCRVSEVVEAVTGDSDYSTDCYYDAMNNPSSADWRIQARRFVRAYKGRAQ